MARPKGVNLKPEEREQIIELYKQGYKTSEIAKMLGVHKSTVSRTTARAGLREKLPTPKRLSQDEIEEIKSLWQTTLLPKEEICRRLGVSLDSVNKYTEGLERNISQEAMDNLIEMYLDGLISAEKVKELIGLTKTQFYAEVAKVVVKNGKGYLS
jgi:Mn-dependent DtxR family transcriptional regulator